jgi:excisionase family DNA binding protein
MAESMDKQPLVLTIPETIREAKLGRTKIYQLIAEGQIEAVKVGSRTLVPYDSLLAWLAKLRSAAS